jgi:hypothetical protein
MRTGSALLLASLIATQANAGEYLYLPKHYEESLRRAQLDMLVDVLKAEIDLREGKAKEAYLLLKDRIGLYEHTDARLKSRAYRAARQAISDYLLEAKDADIAGIEATLMHLNNVDAP